MYIAGGIRSNVRSTSQRPGQGNCISQHSTACTIAGVCKRLQRRGYLLVAVSGLSQRGSE